MSSAVAPHPEQPDPARVLAREALDPLEPAIDELIVVVEQDQ
jgi:hypothetical protein